MSLGRQRVRFGPLLRFVLVAALAARAPSFVNKQRFRAEKNPISGGVSALCDITKGGELDSLRETRYCQKELDL